MFEVGQLVVKFQNEGYIRIGEVCEVTDILSEETAFGDIRVRPLRDKSSKITYSSCFVPFEQEQLDSFMSDFQQEV